MIQRNRSYLCSDTPDERNEFGNPKFIPLLSYKTANECSKDSAFGSLRAKSIATIQRLRGAATKGMEMLVTVLQFD
jgi:hypothetical protein